MDKVIDLLNSLGYSIRYAKMDEIFYDVYHKGDVVVLFYDTTHVVEINGVNELTGYSMYDEHIDQLYQYIKLLNRKETINKLLDGKD